MPVGNIAILPQQSIDIRTITAAPTPAVINKDGLLSHKSAHHRMECPLHSAEGNAFKQNSIIGETMMRKMLLAAILLTVVQGVAMAQSSGEKKGWGYVFAGAGASAGDFSTNYFQVGGGGEGLLNNGFGMGAEIGYLAPFRSGGNGIALFSSGPSYHFNRSSKLVPFVTGGYSAAFRNGASHGGHFGGGVHYWMKDHVGLRFEVRDHVFSSDSPHLFQFRVGLSFR